MDSIGDFNSSPIQRALPNLNLLADLIPPNDESESNPQTDDLGSMRPPPTDLLSRIWDEYEEEGNDFLLKTYPTTSNPTIPQSNTSLSFFHSEKTTNDAETGSKVSSESSSSINAHSTCHALEDALTSPTTSSTFSISDVCNSAEANYGESQSQASRKRKHTEEEARSCPPPDSAKKKRKVTKPSKFCHVCVRSCDQVSMVPCVNVAIGNCRKNICKRCFEKHGIAHEWVTATKNLDLIHRIHTRDLERIPDGAWACLHCRKMCPPNAQCTIYQRTNRRRHESLQQRRKMRLEKEREMEQQMGEVRKREATRQRKIVDSFIYPNGFSTIPLAVPLPPDVLPESDPYFRNGLSHGTEDIFSPLLTRTEAGS